MYTVFFCTDNNVKHLGSILHTIRGVLDPTGMRHYYSEAAAVRNEGRGI